jgi:hypothetical protein
MTYALPLRQLLGFIITITLTLKLMSIQFLHESTKLILFVKDIDTVINIAERFHLRTLFIVKMFNFDNLCWLELAGSEVLKYSTIMSPFETIKSVAKLFLSDNLAGWLFWFVRFSYIQEFETNNPKYKPLSCIFFRLTAGLTKFAADFPTSHKSANITTFFIVFPNVTNGFLRILKKQVFKVFMSAKVGKDYEFFFIILWKFTAGFFKP